MISKGDKKVSSGKKKINIMYIFVGFLVFFIVMSAKNILRISQGLNTYMPQDELSVQFAINGLFPDTNFHTYTVCGDIANQFLGHAVNIAYAIKEDKGVAIPNIFIPDETKETWYSEPMSLSSVIDTHRLRTGLQKLYGKKVVVVPPTTDDCDWGKLIMDVDDQVMHDVLKEMQPSSRLNPIIDELIRRLWVFKDERYNEDGVCLNYYTGRDWSKFCKNWEGIKDGVWRENCVHEDGKSISKVLKNRIQNRQWIYYVGDTKIPVELKKNFNITSEQEVLRGVNLYRQYFPEVSSYASKNLKALASMYVCNQFGHYIGNSVSVWSAIQIAQKPFSSSWYNSRSIPLSEVWKVFHVPFVYSYSEDQPMKGGADIGILFAAKYMLKHSVLSIKKHMPHSPIHIFYHRSRSGEDATFTSWLRRQGAELHYHEPKWDYTIESLGKSKYSSAFYLWEQISEILMTEYCVIMDYDNMVMKPFSLIDFGLDITPTVALGEKRSVTSVSMKTWDVGFGIVNIPFLRSIKEILDKGNKEDFLDIDIASLDERFNMKPWSLNYQKHGYVAHFDGLRPYEILDMWLFKGCNSQYKYICAEQTESSALCDTMQAFAVTITSDEPSLKEFCSVYFGDRSDKFGEQACSFFLVELASQEEGSTCTSLVSTSLKKIQKKVPLVYTYTETGPAHGKHMLKISILSAIKQMPKVPIHVLYHRAAKEDKDIKFIAWLHLQGVTVHVHRPTWAEDIERIRLAGTSEISHLYSHPGAYLGTWQRIDVPDFITSDYVLFLDYDTVIETPFSLMDFGNNLTTTLAFSAEIDENDPRPWNAGVALMHIPFLRETKDAFHRFIFRHKDGRFQNGPSDQGAYNDFYANRTTFLDRTFNVKPYWENELTWKERRVVHFHGMKPNDIMNMWLFGEECNPAVKGLCDRQESMKFLCPSMQSFAKAATIDIEVARDLCEGYYFEDSFEGLLKVRRCRMILKNLEGAEPVAVGASCEQFLPKNEVDIDPVLPIVYTYTEDSPPSGKHMLKISILSVQLQMPNVPINIIYHKSNTTKKDPAFQQWMVDHGITLHDHKPKWADTIENMRKAGNLGTSHLYKHAGAYLGTWQRIDIPDFIQSEYVLLLDYDTIVVKPFTVFDSTLEEVTSVLAFSAEIDEDDPRPWNAGVGLFNVPHLRNTKEDFHKFIFAHKDGQFENGPSDQGAYNDFYPDRSFLDKSFNVKPYWANEQTWRDRRVIHFHGMKPFDLMDLWLFDKECNPAIKFLCDQHETFKFLVPSMQEFAIAAVKDRNVLYDFCSGHYKNHKSLKACERFMIDLSEREPLEIGTTYAKDVLGKSHDETDLI